MVLLLWIAFVLRMSPGRRKIAIHCKGTVLMWPRARHPFRLVGPMHATPSAFGRIRLATQIALEAIRRIITACSMTVHPHHS